MKSSPPRHRRIALGLACVTLAAILAMPARAQDDASHQAAALGRARHRRLAPSGWLKVRNRHRREYCRPGRRCEGRGHVGAVALGRPLPRPHFSPHADRLAARPAIGKLRHCRHVGTCGRQGAESAGAGRARHHAERQGPAGCRRRTNLRHGCGRRRVRPGMLGTARTAVRRRPRCPTFR